MNTSVTTERKSFLPLRVRSNTIVGSSSIPSTSRPTTPVTTSMSLTAQNDIKSSFEVGNRVLVNGLKIGTIRYIGRVQFAEGLFCGIELDEPDGKHDGQVHNKRYFHCKTNHGVFVPNDKVVLAPQERVSTSQRLISRLKPPAIPRSMTISTSVNNKIEKNPLKSSSSLSSKLVQLPDIIPNSSTSIQQISNIEINNDEILSSNEQSKSIIESINKSETLTIDESVEPIEADFTDSVSLVLHKLQQEQENLLNQSRGSIAISEEGTIDDEDYDDEEEEEEDDDNDDEGNINESDHENEILHQSSSTIDFKKSHQINNSNGNLKILKRNSLNSKSLTNSNTSINKLSINVLDNKSNFNKKKASVPTFIPLIKKDPQRKLSVPVINIRTLQRQASFTSPKQSLLSINKLNSKKSIVSFGSQSKLNQSISPSNSINHSQSDLTSNIPKLSKTTSNITREQFDHELIRQKFLNQTIKNQYQHLLNQFDLICIISQYYITENEQTQQEYQSILSKIRIEYDRLKILNEQLKLSHKNQLDTLNEQYRNQIDKIKDIHKQESIKYQQQIEKLSSEKNELEIRCTSLQEKVDRFMEEMANSEHADPLLRHVEILEKDKASLQTVLEFKNQEITQLRTKINEQVFQREDHMTLQRRIDMVENRNQDLVCLLRNWQLNEKVVAVERDQLKEQLAQLERDKRQLTFENETLRYCIRQRALRMSNTSVSKSNLPPLSTQKLRKRAYSLSSIITNTHDNEHFTRSISLNCVSNW